MTQQYQIQSSFSQEKSVTVRECKLPISVDLLLLLESIPIERVLMFIQATSFTSNEEYSNKIINIVDPILEQQNFNNINLSYLFSNILPNQISKYREFAYWRQILVLLHLALIFPQVIKPKQKVDNPFQRLKGDSAFNLHFSNVFTGGLLQPCNYQQFFQMSDGNIHCDFSAVVIGLCGSYNLLLSTMQLIFHQYLLQTVVDKVDLQEKTKDDLINDYTFYNTNIAILSESLDIHATAARLDCIASSYDQEEASKLFSILNVQRIYLHNKDCINNYKRKLFQIYMSKQSSTQLQSFAKKCLFMLEFPILLTSQFQFKDINETNLNNDGFFVGFKTSGQQLESLYYSCINNIQEDESVLFICQILNFSQPIETIYYKKQEISGKNNICLVDCTKGLQIVLPKSLFLWSQNKRQTIYLQQLFSHNVSKFIDRTTPGILQENQNKENCISLVNNVIQGLKEKQIDVLIDFDFHLVIGEKDAGNQYYNDFYSFIRSPVMIQNSLVNMQIPDVRVMRNAVTSQPIKRLILDYQKYETFECAIAEIRNLQFKYQIQGIFLNGFEEIDDFVIEYIDKILAIQFPNIKFYAVLPMFKFDIHVSKIIEVGGVNHQMYIYNNTIRDLLEFPNLYNKPIIFSLQSLRNTIDSRNLINLTEQSLFEHEIYKMTKFASRINHENQIVSLKNQFEQFLFESMNNVISFKHYEIISGLNAFRFIYTGYLRLIFINTSSRKSLNSLLLKDGSNILDLGLFDQNDIVHMKVNQQYYLAPVDKLIYVFNPENQQSTVMLKEQISYPQLWSLLHKTIMFDIDAYSVQIVDIVQHNNMNGKQITEYYRTISNESQFTALTTSYEIFNAICVRFDLTSAEVFDIFFRSNYGLYLYLFDQISSKKLKIPSQFSSDNWKPLVLDRQQFIEYYPLHLLLKLLNTRETQLTNTLQSFFEMDYVSCIEVLRKTVQIAYPQFVQQINGIHNYRPQVNTTILKYSIDDIKHSKFNCEVMVLFSRISKKLAYFCSYLSSFGYKVLAIGPMFETPSELEGLPEEVIGQSTYTYQNWFDNHTCKDYGIHHSQHQNCQYVFLHNFEIFKDYNLFGAIKQSLTDQSLADFVHSPMFCANTAEPLLQRASAQSSFALHIFQRFTAPRIVIATGGFSSLALLTVEKYFSQQIQTMHERQQVPLTFKPPIYLQWFESNCRDIFECKNDIIGYEIFNEGFIRWLLSQLQIDQSTAFDECHPRKLFSLRGSLQLVQKIYTNAQISALLSSMGHYNFLLGNKVQIIGDGFQGMQRLILDVLDALK